MKLSIVVGGVVLVAAAAGLAAPYWVGVQTEKYYDSIIHDAANRYGFNLKDVAYHRGWFSSSSRIKFHIPRDKSGKPPYVITLVSDIHHGPVIFGVSDHPVVAASVAVTTVEFPHDLDAPLHFYFGDKAPVRMTTTVTFDGASNTHLFSPAYNGPSQDGRLTVSWKGMVGDSASTGISAGAKITSSFKAPGLVVKGQGGIVEFQSFAASGEGQRTASGIFPGRATISLAKLDLDVPSQNAPNTHLMLSGLSFSDNVAPKEHMLTMKLGAGVKDIEVADQHYGPGQYDMELRNLGEHVVAEYVKTMRDLRAMQPRGAQNAKSMTDLRRRLMSLANEFLKNSPQFEISRVSLGTKEGEVGGRFLITFDGTGGFNMQNIAQLIPRVHAEANAQAPEMLFKTVLAGIARSHLASALKAKNQKLPDEDTLTTNAMAVMEQEIQSMVDNGFIVNEGGRYTARLLFDKGRLTVNDRPMGSQGL